MRRFDPGPRLQFFLAVFLPYKNFRNLFMQIGTISPHFQGCAFFVNFRAFSAETAQF